MWGSWSQNFDVVHVQNPYLAPSLCCYLTPFDFDDIVRMGVKGWFGDAFLLFEHQTLSPT